MMLPDPIRIYFEARAPQDGATLAAAFAPDAVVRDEGQSHHGPQAIRDWWSAAKAKYRHHADPIDATQDGDKTVVRTTVTGDFPGSPATLSFSFGLSGDRITSLEIG